MLVHKTLVEAKTNPQIDIHSNVDYVDRVLEGYTPQNSSGMDKLWEAQELYEGHKEIKDQVDETRREESKKAGIEKRKKTMSDRRAEKWAEEQHEQELAAKAKEYESLMVCNFF